MKLCYQGVQRGVSPETSKKKKQATNGVWKGDGWGHVIQCSIHAIQFVSHLSADPNHQGYHRL